MAIEPIVLDEFGAILVPLLSENRTRLQFEFIVGTHQGCTNRHKHNRIDAQYHSPSHNCLLCQGCQLRIIVPNGILPLIMIDEVFEPLRRFLHHTIELKTQDFGRTPQWVPDSVFDDDDQ